MRQLKEGNLWLKKQWADLSPRRRCCRTCWQKELTLARLREWGREYLMECSLGL